MTTYFNRRNFLKIAGGMLLSAGVVAVDNLGLVERYQRSQLPTVEAQAPNVLLIVMDAVRAQNLSLYGYHRPTTPNLERLAKSGVVFERAIASAPWTLPSHASMFTGRWHHELSTNWTTPLDQTYPTQAEVLREHGYLTGGFVANTEYCSYEMGLNRGFMHYDDHLHGLGAVIESSGFFQTLQRNYKLRHLLNDFELPGRKPANIINEEFLHWLAHRGEQPFFAFLNYYDAHDPYLPPEPFDQMFGPVIRRGNPWLYPDFEWTPEQVQVEMNAYDGAIAYIDQQIGILLDQLGRQGHLENTLVMIVSDHGEQFGDHNLMGHGNSLYIQSLRVPLMMIFPAHIPANKRISSPVSMRNLPATVLDLLGQSNEAGFPGQSLTRYWVESPSIILADGDKILSEMMYTPGLQIPEGPLRKGDMRSLVRGQYHYILNGDGSEELYDIERDPEEFKNIESSEEVQNELTWFRDNLNGK